MAADWHQEYLKLQQRHYELLRWRDTAVDHIAQLQQLNERLKARQVDEVEAEVPLRAAS